MTALFRSIRFRMALVYSAVVFGLTALVYLGVYAGLALRSDPPPATIVTQRVVGTAESGLPFKKIVLNVDPGASLKTEVQRQAHRATAEEGPDPGEQLGEGERLDEVVVGAVVEPGDAVGETVARGQHQHPRRRLPVRALGRDDPAAHLPAVDTREVEIETDQVVRVDGRLDERVAAVVGDVHRIALATEPERDRVREVRLVLDDQQAHALSVGRALFTPPLPRS